MTTSEKVAYLRGLAEGYGLDSATHEGKVLSSILDILEDLSLDVKDLSATMRDMEEDLSTVKGDMADVEEILFGPGEEILEDEEEGDDPDHFLYKITCPACGETISFDEDTLLQGLIECPACGKQLQLLPGEPEEDQED